METVTLTIDGRQITVEKGKTILQAAIEHGFHERVAARHYVAHDPDIGREADLVRAKSLDQFDALLGELRAHGRIDVGVAAGHRMAGRLRDCRDAAHESAADAENVEMHRSDNGEETRF